jgi:hypothetical protein
MLLLINPLELHGQPTDLRFEHLTVKEGLSFNEVTAIIQDSRGFMWLLVHAGIETPIPGPIGFVREKSIPETFCGFVFRSHWRGR